MGERDVAIAMEQILGDRLAIIRDFCFVRQGRMTDVLQDGDAARSRLLQALCDGPRAERIYRYIGDAVADIRVEDVSTALASARERLDEAKYALTDLKEEEYTLPKAPSDDEVSKAREAIDNHHHAFKYAEEYRLAKSRHESAVNETYEVRDYLRTAQEKIQALDDLPPRGDMTLEELEPEIQRLQRLINGIGHGVVECPTCGTPATELKGVLEDAQSRLPQLKDDRDELRRRIKERLELEDWERSEARRVDHCKRTEDMWFAKVASMDKSVAGLLRPEYLEEYKAVVAAYDHATQRRAVIDQKRSVLIREEKRAARDLYALQETQNQNDKIRGLIEELRDVRKGFHHEGAPLIAATKAMRALEAVCNDLLSVARVGYTIRALDDLSFEVIDDRGGRRVASRLSGGQQILLSLIVRVALNSVFAADLGFLVLDEPTCFLDREALNAMEGAFEHLKSMASDRGLQCLVVTHEDRILRMFDHTIPIGGS
jgi:DNA repair exonuclease SbcCD ATPase subunit